MTGAGMADVRTALSEAENDLDKAAENLRKKGIAKAAKRSGREAREGIIKIAMDETGNEGYMVEVNAETDFVTRNDKFIDFVDELMKIIKSEKPADLETLKSLPMGESTVEETLNNLSGTIGEKMGIKRFVVLSSQGTVAAYSHMGGRIGVLVALDQADRQELAYDIAMQVAAANPKYLFPEDVGEAELTKEKEIYKEQLTREDKPAQIIDKIIDGKLKKYYEEVCLVEQEYIKDDKQKIKDVLGDVKIEKFIRFSLS